MMTVHTGGTHIRDDDRGSGRRRGSGVVWCSSGRNERLDTVVTIAVGIRGGVVEA
jgi:hypothetical protein